MCPWNGPGLSSHPSRSWGQPVHVSFFPCTGVRKNAQRHLPKSHGFLVVFNRSVWWILPTRPSSLILPNWLWVFFIDDQETEKYQYPQICFSGFQTLIFFVSCYLWSSSETWRLVVIKTGSNEDEDPDDSRTPCKGLHRYMSQWLVLITDSEQHDDIIMQNIDDPIITVVVSVVISLLISLLVEMSLMKFDKKPVSSTGVRMSSTDTQCNTQFFRRRLGDTWQKRGEGSSSPQLWTSLRSTNLKLVL